MLRKENPGEGTGATRKEKRRRFAYHFNHLVLACQAAGISLAATAGCLALAWEVAEVVK